MNLGKLISSKKITILIAISFIVLSIIWPQRISLCMPCCAKNYGWPLAILEEGYENGSKCAEYLGESLHIKVSAVGIVVDFLFFYTVSYILIFIKNFISKKISKH